MEALICKCTGVTAGVGASLKVQCAMNHFRVTRLLDQSITINFSEFDVFLFSYVNKLFKL